MPTLRSRLARLGKLLCLLLLCLYIGGCTPLPEPGGCRGGPPTWYPPNLLRIWERDDYDTYTAPLFQKVCYDDTWVYYLRKAEKGTDLCRAMPGQDVTVLHTFSVPVTQVACRGDALLVYGQLRNENLEDADKRQKTYWDSKHGVYVLSKEPSAAEPVLLTGTGAWWNIPGLEKSAYVARNMLPLKVVFNESTEDQPFGLLWGDLFPQSILGKYTSKERYTSLLRIAGGEPVGEYHFKGAWSNWVLYRTGDWMTALDNYNDGTVSLDAQYYLSPAASESGVLYGLPPYMLSYDVVFYNGFPYALRLNAPEYYIWPCVESGKSLLEIPTQKEYSLTKRYSGEKGRMQYIIYTAYDEPEREPIDRPAEYDVFPVASNQITAVDLETMQLTRTLTLPTPHEQVLYVSAAGAYTWRHDEGRVYLTDWEGQSKPVSDVIPFTPRYETKQDEEGGNTCNTWYVEFDAARSRLLIFDMTQGETALLAAVPVA